MWNVPKNRTLTQTKVSSLSLLAQSWEQGCTIHRRACAVSHAVKSKSDLKHTHTHTHDTRQRPAFFTWENKPSSEILETAQYPTLWTSCQESKFENTQNVHAAAEMMRQSTSYPVGKNNVKLRFSGGSHFGGTQAKWCGQHFKHVTHRSHIVNFVIIKKKKKEKKKGSICLVVVDKYPQQPELTAHLHFCG